MCKMTNCTSSMHVSARILLLLMVTYRATSDVPSRKLPENFLLGVATSSYQIEGGWNEDGKGESIWDFACHRTSLIKDNSNGDVACDSYHKIDEDIALLKSLGVDHYRFSISWTRILPGGFANSINPAGIDYYNDLINKLLAEGITPMVTIYHWDLPQTLQILGGWANNEIQYWFKDYARVLFQQFGDRVKLWITINEPRSICYYGYGSGRFAPGIKMTGFADYLCARNLLLAHAQVYHLYNTTFRPIQSGRIGITIESSWHEPLTQRVHDGLAAYRSWEFEFGIYANPIFHKSGDFPAVVKKSVAKRSKVEGFYKSRLPELSRTEIDFIRRTADFLGLNHYTTKFVAHGQPYVISEIGQHADMQIKFYHDGDWISGSLSYFKFVPWGLRKLLNHLSNLYGNLEIMITENGFPDNGEIDDQNRIKYHQGHLNAVLDAIYEDGVNVTAYTAWSLMDNFEWSDGYSPTFGLFSVNFTDPKRGRTPKSSCNMFKKLTNSRRLPNVGEWRIQESPRRLVFHGNM